MRVTLVHNPSSGDGRPSQHKLERLLESAGYQVRYTSTDRDWKDALRKKTDLVVAAGGDGTVGKVIRELAGSGAPFGVLPFGTANNVAKSLGVVGEIEDVVAAWRDGAPRPFDVWSAAIGDEDELFVEGAGGGVFADLIHLGEDLVEDADLYVGRETDRALALLRGLIEDAQPSTWNVELDGTDHSGDYLAVEALNIKFAGPNVPLAPRADPGDGLLDVVLIGDEERRSILDYLAGRLELSAGVTPDVRVVRASRARLVAPHGVRVRVDDEVLADAKDGEDRSIDVRLHAVARSLAGGQER